MYKDLDTIQNHVTNLSAIKNSIKNILLTRRGSVPGKPRFGSDLYNVIFSPMDHLTKAMAKNYVKEALDEFEPRITIISVEIKSVEEYNKIIIDMLFRYTDPSFNIENANQTDSLSISINL